MHIPFSIGLAISRKHNIDVAFTYYYQPSVEQFSGATAIRFSFPMKNNRLERNITILIRKHKLVHRKIQNIRFHGGANDFFDSFFEQ